MKQTPLTEDDLDKRLLEAQRILESIRPRPLPDGMRERDAARKAAFAVAKKGNNAPRVPSALRGAPK